VLAVHVAQPAWDDAYVAKVRAFVPLLEYHEWEGVNHCLMMDEPERFNALMRAFLTKHSLP